MSGIGVWFNRYPVFYDFPEYLSSPSQGMLCFADFFMEADGDVVLFDVAAGLHDDEYPVMYYSHEDRPPTVRMLAPTFPQFLNEFLTYEEFTNEDDEEEDE